MQVWKSLDRFSGQSHIDTWAYRVALNTALAWDREVQRRDKRFVKQPSDVSALPSAAPSDGREERILEEFLASLSKMDRAAMLLYLEDVPGGTSAEILGLTEGALRVRMHRIRKRFEAAYCEQVETA